MKRIKLEDLAVGETLKSWFTDMRFWLIIGIVVLFVVLGAWGRAFWPALRGFLME